MSAVKRSASVRSASASDRQNTSNQSINGGGSPTKGSFGSPYAQDVSVSVYPLQDDLNEEMMFPDNSIKTSKYTLLTFFPYNLFHQFKKVSNFYFALTALISSIPGASPVTPAANIIPLIFVVGVSMLKDGYEDFRRHQADNRANSIEATILKAGEVKFRKVRSREIKVGDILLIGHNEEIRADCVLLNSSHPEGTAYIDTANLDGESSLKSKRSKYCTREHLGSIDLLIKTCEPKLLEERAKAREEEEEEKRKKEEAEEEARRARRGSRFGSRGGSGANTPVSNSEPLGSARSQDEEVFSTARTAATPTKTTAELASSTQEHQEGFSAARTRSQTSQLAEAAAANNSRSAAEEDDEEEEEWPTVIMGSPAHPNLDAWKGQVRIRATPYPLGIDQFLYRGAVLRNTDWALGLVMYAGVDTKMFLNLQQKPSKMSTLDVKLNFLIGLVFAVNQLLIILLCSLSVGWWATAKKKQNENDSGRRGLWYVQSDLDSFSGVSLWFWHYLGYFVLLSYMIPISLFVTMELCKAAQAMLMMFDHDLMHWDGKDEWRGCRPKTSSINDQLALVRFIFTDKTGTLTENVMKYVGGLIGETTYDVVTDGAKKLGELAAEGRMRSLELRESGGSATEDVNGNSSSQPQVISVTTTTGENDGGSPAEHRRPSASNRMMAAPVEVDPALTKLAKAADRAATGEDSDDDESESKGPPGGGGGVGGGNTHIRTQTLEYNMNGESPPPQPNDELLEGEEEDYPDYLDDMHSLYLMAMATCHGVICFKEGDNIVYDGQSPDEIAFVRAAKENGFSLVSRNSSLMEVEIEGEEFTRTFEILAELEFDASRKMMSILLKDADTDVNILFTKGADSSILAHASESEHNLEYRPRLELNLKNLAEVGYRTLLIGCRVVSEAEADAFKKAHDKASISMADRDAELREVYKTVEHSLELVGSTGVEDKLQDEVPETIQFCLDANIVVWMLTGDKRETAVTIAATSRLLHPQTQRIAHVDVSTMNHSSEEAMMQVATEAKKQLEEALKIAQEHETVLVIDGKTLATVLSPQFQEMEEFSSMLPTFIELGFKVVSGVCCRLTPLQKAEIVRIFQDKTSATALAIGDGANDVSMIQEGKVGIGIMGREGSQAELASDYAIPKFRHLKRLMFVHGRDALYRNTGCISFSLYKNMALCCCLVLYGFFSGYTAIPVFESWVLSMYNTIFCQLPPMFFGMLDRDVKSGIGMKYPYIFPPLARTGQYFNGKELAKWTADYLLHGFSLFWMGYALFRGDDLRNGSSGSLEMHGTTFYFALVVFINFRIALMIRSWNVIQALGIGASLVVTFVFILLYSVMAPNGEWYKGVIFALLPEAKFYFFILMFDLGVLMIWNVSREYILQSEVPSLAVVAMNTEEKAKEQRKTSGEELTNVVPGAA